MEIDIKILCRHLEDSLDRLPDSSKQTVTYFNGKKSTYADNGEEAWFSEIYVNKLCVFREYVLLNPNNGDWEESERLANLRLISSVFSHGVVSANNTTKDWIKKQEC
jgi:hypothetical protein